jgi:hypothetical protein
MTSTFDDMSKVLASGVSRRDALKLIGGTVGGSALAALGIGRARAAVSSCAAFCANFHGAAHAQCMQTCKQCGSDPSRLCFNFGPSPSVTCCPGPGPVTCCSGPNGSTTCCPSGSNCCFAFATNTTTCCPSGTHCCQSFDGTSTTCCANGAMCCDATCCIAGDVCCSAPGGPFCCTPGTLGCCA